MAVPPTQHFVAIAAIFNDQHQILLTRRNLPANPTVHNHWQFPGGGIEFGEHPKDALLREIQEETALQVRVLSDQPAIFSHVFEKTNAHIVLFMYLTKYASGILDISQDSEETNDAQWFSLQEIPNLLSLPLTDLIANTAHAMYQSLIKE